MDRIAGQRCLRAAAFALLAVLLPAAFSQVADIPDTALLLKITVTGPRNLPLADVEISLDTNVIGHTDETGAFYMPRKPYDAGQHTLSFSLIGYETRKQTALFPAAAESLPVRVQIQLRPFVPKPPETVSTAIPNYRVYEVFYATDRASSRSKDPETYYKGAFSSTGSLEYGTCNVSIPAGHKKGVIETPSIIRMEFQYDPDKHVMLRLPQPLPVDKFFDKLSSKVGQSVKKEAFVYIHGYNTTFAYAAKIASQLAADLEFDGAPILYSWPSPGRLTGYFTDQKSVETSAPHLEAFLEQVALRANATRVHLFAHSMGNRVMSASLRAMLPLANRVTLYASQNDDALILARIIDGVARAGERINEALMPGIDAVDASAVRTDFIGHGYFAESNPVLADLKQLLLLDATPELRKLAPAKLADLPYWIIPSAVANR